MGIINIIVYGIAWRDVIVLIEWRKIEMHWA